MSTLQKITSTEIRSLKKKLSLDDLKKILCFRFRLEIEERETLITNIQADLMGYAKDWRDDPILVFLDTKVAEWLADVYAPWLMGSGKKPLDFREEMYNHFMDFMGKQSLNLKSESIYNSLQACREIVANGFVWFQRAKSIPEILETSPGRFYHEQWAWVRTVKKMAASWDVSPIEYLFLSTVPLEMAQALFTREEFIAYGLKKWDQEMNLETVKKRYLEPKIQQRLSSIGSGAEQEKIRQEITKKYLPKIEEGVKRYKKVITAWFNEEAERIYDP